MNVSVACPPRAPRERMGPFTHASKVCRLMVQHISANEAGKRPRHWRGATSILGVALQPAKAAS